MFRMGLLAALVALLAATAPATASIAIVRGDGGPITPDVATIEFNALTGGYDVTLKSLYAPGGNTKYWVYGNEGVVIDNVYIDVPCLQNPSGECAPVGSPVYVEVRPVEPGGIAAIHNVEQRDRAELYLTWVEATGDVGSVSAWVVGTVKAGGDVFGPVMSTREDTSIMGVFSVEAIGSILGDVIAKGGRIGQVFGHAGVGALGAEVRIEAKYHIVIVASYGDIHAQINARVHGGTGWIFLLDGQRFYGSLDAYEIKPDPSTGTPGRLSAPLGLYADVRLGKGFNNATCWMQLPQAGFNRQIILNYDNVSGSTWTSPIWLGPVGAPTSQMLNSPNYTIAASAMGGGSIGLVPFSLHDESCEPANGGSMPANGTARLRHYGPVKLLGMTPLSISRRPAGSSSSFAPVALSKFTISVDPQDPRVLRVVNAPGQSGFELGWQYRILAGASLRSDVPAAPGVSWQGEYLLTVTAATGGTPCPADVSGNGTIDFSDLLQILNAWGPCG